MLRDSAAGVEVFMVRRTATIAFMAGAHVFPGGRVDAGDRGDFRLSAVRELFEEARLLLARDHAGAWVPIASADQRARWDLAREDVHAGRRPFADVLAEAALTPALDAVVPFAHWVTPPNEVRRFDTRFFLAAAPPGQLAAHEAAESDASGWLRPAEALARCRDGGLHLPPPTWATLRELEPLTTVAAALTWAQRRAIVARAPILRERDGRREILLPGDPEHPAREVVAYETRFVWTGNRWLPVGPGD